MDDNILSKIDYQDILENTLDPFWIIDAENMRIIYSNKAYCAMSGYTKSEIIGKTITDFEAQEEEDEIRERINRAIKDKGCNFIGTHKTKNGSIINLHITSKLAVIDCKNIIFSFMKNITQTLEREKTLKDSEAKLYNLNTQLMEMVRQETQKRVTKELAFTSIFQLFGTGVAIVDENTVIVDINRQLISLLELEVDNSQLIGRNFIELLHESEYARAEVGFQRMLEETMSTSCFCDTNKNTKHCNAKQREFIFKIKNGKEVDTLVNIACFKADSGKINFVFSITDITAIRNFEKREKENEKILITQSKMAAMGEMIGAIAHQWRQPLNLLGIMVQDVPYCFDNGEFDEKYAHNFTKKAMEQIYFMSKTIDDFRNFFRNDKSIKDFYLAKHVKSSLSLVSDMFKAHSIEILLIEDNDPIIVGYPNELSQVILNIISNSKDAFESTKTTSKCKITVTVTSDENHGIVIIADNAGGIPENIIDRIFEPYFTTKAEGKGTGIGLYMSKTIIDTNMKGLLTVHNENDGAVFTIKIPLSQA